MLKKAKAKAGLILYFLAQAPQTINTLALTSTTILLVKICFLNQIPAPITWFTELGNLFEAILTSVIASYIFYLIVVHKKNLDERAAISPIVKKLLERAIKNMEKSLGDISQASGLNLDLETIDKNSLRSAMSKINPYSSAPLRLLNNLNKANWLEYLENQRIIIQSHTSKVISLANFVDHDTISLVSKIDFCDHFRIINQLHNQKLRTANLAFCTDNYYELVDECRSLKKQLCI